MHRCRCRRRRATAPCRVRVYINTSREILWNASTSLPAHVQLIIESILSGRWATSSSSRSHSNGSIESKFMERALVECMNMFVLFQCSAGAADCLIVRFCMRYSFSVCLFRPDQRNARASRNAATQRKINEKTHRASCRAFLACACDDKLRRCDVAMLPEC